MSTSKPSSWLQDKRGFYSRPEVSRLYDQQRFGGPGGARVNARELALVADLLPPGGRVLDLGCGTGRLSAHLLERGYSVVGLDTSPEMLRLAKSRAAIPTVQADGFALPFKAGAFDAVVALRLAFHYQDLGALLAAASSVVVSGGTLIFDTCSRSPRAFVALRAGSWGGKVWIHRPAEVRRLAAELGLAIKNDVPCFFFSPYLYRLLPLPAVLALERLEKAAPPGLLVRRFWQAEATPKPATTGSAVPAGAAT